MTKRSRSRTSKEQGSVPFKRDSSDSCSLEDEDEHEKEEPRLATAMIRTAEHLWSMGMPEEKVVEALQERRAHSDSLQTVDVRVTYTQQK